MKKQDSAQELPIRAATDDEEFDRLNTGIATVTPIQEVLDIINSDPVVAVRRKAEARYYTHGLETFDVLRSAKKRPNARPKK